MIKEIIKGIISIVVLLGIILYPEVREYTIPALTLIIGYYFGKGKETLVGLGISKKK